MLVVTLAVAANFTAIWRFSGGPLSLRGQGGSGLHLSADLPTGRTLYYAVPYLDGPLDATIEQMHVVNASEGVRVTGLFVRMHGPTADARVLDGSEAFVNISQQGTFAPPPASVSIPCECEGERVLLIAFELTAGGPQSIEGLAVDYRTGLWTYHTVLFLVDWNSPSSGL